MFREVGVAPSILSADFGSLREAVALVEDAGASAVHVDVMDGHFVPNLTIGPPVVAALKRCARIPLDVHLMVDNPDETVGWYLDAGADWVTVHVEASQHLNRIVASIHDAGARAGVSLNPATPVEELREILPFVDLVLVMSVNPGFGGQSFIATSVGKIEQLASLAQDLGVDPLIAVDGGIDERTAPQVTRAGARLLVAGSAVFGADDPAKAIEAIRSAGASAL
ncbi:MAG: ribulose-phosphate 3-epimerase [Coriobacteriia bacterium]